MSLMDLIYPKRCPVCLDALPPGKKLICNPCREKIRLVGEPRCFRCGKAISDETREYCRDCERRKPGYEQAYVWAEYTSFYIRRMLSEVKYHGNAQILDYPCLDFATRYKEKISEWNAEVLIPVPIHKSKYRERGYNQATEIAKRLSKVLNIPVDESFLYRIEKTKAQKELTGSERNLNLSSAFRTHSVKEYRTVILVDDILTTGSTAESCVFAMKKGGVEKVYCLFMAAGRDGS